MECKMKSQDLLRVKEKYESQLQEFNATLDGYNDKVSTLQELCDQNKLGQEMQLKKFKAEVIHIQCDRLCKLLVNLGEEFSELRDDILVDMKNSGLLKIS